MNVNRWLWWVCDDFESQQVIVKFVPHPFQRLVDKFCDERCHISLVTDLNMMPSTEKIIRKVSADWQAGNSLWKEFSLLQEFCQQSLSITVSKQVANDDIHFIAYVDFTKLGTLNQQDINQHASWLQGVLNKNPLRSLVASNLKPFTSVLFVAVSALGNVLTCPLSNNVSHDSLTEAPLELWFVRSWLVKLQEAVCVQTRGQGFEEYFRNSKTIVCVANWFQNVNQTCWLCWPLSGALRTSWPNSNWNYGLSTLPSICPTFMGMQNSLLVTAPC